MCLPRLQDEEEYEGILYGYGFSYVFLKAFLCVDHVVVLVQQLLQKESRVLMKAMCTLTRGDIVGRECSWGSSFLKPVSE